MTQSIAPQGILSASHHYDATTRTRGFSHLVTLIHFSTGEEKTIWVETETERFSEVWDAIAFVKHKEKMFGFEIFETLQVSDYRKAQSLGE